MRDIEKRRHLEPGFVEQARAHGRIAIRVALPACVDEKANDGIEFLDVVRIDGRPTALGTDTRLGNEWIDEIRHLFSDFGDRDHSNAPKGV